MRMCATVLVDNCLLIWLIAILCYWIVVFLFYQSSFLLLIDPVDGIIFRIFRPDLILIWGFHLKALAILTCVSPGPVFLIFQPRNGFSSSFKVSFVTTEDSMWFFMSSLVQSASSLRLQIDSVIPVDSRNCCSISVRIDVIVERWLLESLVKSGFETVYSLTISPFDAC